MASLGRRPFARRASWASGSWDGGGRVIGADGSGSRRGGPRGRPARGPAGPGGGRRGCPCGKDLQRSGDVRAGRLMGGSGYQVGERPRRESALNAWVLWNLVEDERWVSTRIRWGAPKMRGSGSHRASARPRVGLRLVGGRGFRDPRGHALMHRTLREPRCHAQQQHEPRSRARPRGRQPGSPGIGLRGARIRRPEGACGRGLQGSGRMRHPPHPLSSDPDHGTTRA